MPLQVALGIGDGTGALCFFSISVLDGQAGSGGARRNACGFTLLNEAAVLAGAVAEENLQPAKCRWGD
jgi:hypothetical protein